jgi:hypothetical protein
VHDLKWWWGLPLALAISVGWILAVWRINPEHVRSVLLGDEIVGRLTGTGPEGSHEGLRGWFLTFFNMAIYFLIRFLPWSLPAIAAMWLVTRKPRFTTATSHMPKADSRLHCWLRAASLFVIVVVIVFSLSAGKRADYIAAAFAPGSLLAAWWLLLGAGEIVERRPWIAPALATITLAAMIVVNQLQLFAPSTNFGPAIAAFIDETEITLAGEPLPLVLVYTGETQMQAMLGLSQADDPREVTQRIRERQPFWVIAGRRLEPPYDYGEWLMQRRRVNAEPVVQSALLPHDRGWPQQLTLYRMTPGGQRGIEPDDGPH